MAMMQIGSVQFTPQGPGYDAFTHRARFEWPAQPRMGRRDALQFTGEGEETVEIQGVVYADYFGGVDVPKQLRSLGRRPQMVVSGSGDVHGLWCVIEVSNVHTYSDAKGRPRKVEFTVTLSAYGPDGGGFGGRLF